MAQKRTWRTPAMIGRFAPGTDIPGLDSARPKIWSNHHLGGETDDTNDTIGAKQTIHDVR